MHQQARKKKKKEICQQVMLANNAKNFIGRPKVGAT